MFANRYTAFIDACVLAGALKRNILLSLAEEEFFRVRWSLEVMQETKRALMKIFSLHGIEDPEAKANKHINAMLNAFEEATVSDYEAYKKICVSLPDFDDIHVFAAALKTKADVIVTDNIKHFPIEIVSEHSMEVRTADDFIADTIMLNPNKAVRAISRMRARFKNPEMNGEKLLQEMDSKGLIETVNALKDFKDFL